MDDRPRVNFDIDGTLVAWEYDPTKESVEINGNMFNIHKAHIDQLKKHKARNHQVEVWSAGGADWAKSVIKALQLEEFVDIVGPKPSWCYDDLPANEFINVVYLEDK